MGHQQQTTSRISKRFNPNRVDQCFGKSCRSCTGRVVADCVAVCCCPCAVVNLFTLAFLKVPWMMGRRCLIDIKRKKKLKNEEKGGALRKVQGEDADTGEVIAVDEEVGSCKYSARFEAERVWLELYRVDNFGFGRVSFNGIHSLGV